MKNPLIVIFNKCEIVRVRILALLLRALPGALVRVSIDTPGTG